MREKYDFFPAKQDRNLNMRNYAIEKYQFYIFLVKEFEDFIQNRFFNLKILNSIYLLFINILNF